MTSSTAGLSHLVSYLRSSGYQVEIANASAQESTMLGGNPSLYVLIGADEPLTAPEQQTIYSRYQTGNMSIIMAEGNKTNAPFIANYFGGAVTGDVITDYSSTFANQREFYVPLNHGGAIANTLIDVASPLVIHGSLTPGAVS